MAITFGAVNGNWSDPTKWVGGVAPTAADDVLFTVASANCSVDTLTCLARSVDCTGYTGTLTINAASTLSVGDASGGAFKLVAGMTFTSSNGLTSILKFVSTSNNGGTGWAITSAGKTIGTLQFDGVGGKWVLQDTTATGGALSSITVTNGAFFGNGKTITTGNLSSSNANTRTIDITSCPITISGTAGTPLNLGTTTGLTFTSTSSTITLSGAGNLTWASGSLTYASVTRTGTAAKTDTLLITGNPTLTGTFTVTGNSTINRILLASAVRGTQVTITAAVVTMSRVDLMDIVGAGAGSWDLSAITGSSGDCGGNSGITFTPAATQTHTTSAGGNWGDNTKWTSRIPLPQDDVVIDANTTGTVSVNMARICKTLTLTGFVGTIDFSSLANELYGSVVFSAGMTLTGTQNLSLSGRGTHTVTFAGQTYLGQVLVNGPGGTYTQQDAFITALAFSMGAGTWTTGNFPMTMLNGVFNFGANALCVLNLGSSTITLTRSTAASVWAASAGSVINAGTSTFVISVASASARTATWGGYTYYAFTYTVAGSTGAFTFNDAPIFDTINFSDVTNARTLNLPAASAVTVRQFNVVGTSGKLMSVTGDVFSTVQQSIMDFLSISGSDATGGPWYAGANSVDGGSNTGWVFGVAPPFVPGGDRDDLGQGIGKRKRSSRKERLTNTKTPYYSVSNSR